METTITASVTPLGGVKRRLPLAVEPSWERAEQGGYRDASLIVKERHDDLLGAALTLYGPHGPVWFGDIADVDSTAITGIGFQHRLAEQIRGAAYVQTGGEWWNDWQGRDYGDGPNADNDNGGIVFTYNTRAYTAGRSAYRIFHFPQPVASCKVRLVASDVPSSSYATQLYYAKGYSTRTWTSVRTVTADGTTNDTITDTDITSLLLKAYRVTDGTPSSEYDITIVPTVWGTSDTTTSEASIASHILTAAGSYAVPHIDVDASLTASVTDLRTEAISTEADNMAALIALGSNRFYFDRRYVGGVWIPAGVFAARASSPSRTLVEDGVSVVCDLTGRSVRDKVTKVRVAYYDSIGRTRYVDVTDTTASNPFVYGGVTKHTSITVDTRSSSVATAAGQVYIAEANRDRVSGTVMLSGAPGGIIACEWQPGEMVRLMSRELGAVNARITSATYSGSAQATLTLDDTPDLDAIIARFIDSKRRP